MKDFMSQCDALDQHGEPCVKFANCHIGYGGWYWDFCPSHFVQLAESAVETRFGHSLEWDDIASDAWHVDLDAISDSGEIETA